MPAERPRHAGWIEQGLAADQSREVQIYAHIGKEHKEDPGYALCGRALQRTDEERDISVTIDDKFSFEKHIKAKVNMANSMFSLIRRSFQFLDKQSVPIIMQDYG